MIRFTNIADGKVAEWMSESDPDNKHELANKIVFSAEQLVDELETQLAEARRDVARAQALKTMTHEFPCWKNTLGNRRLTTHEDQQKACKDLGYEFYVFNHKVFTRMGIDLGMSADDLV